MQWESCVGLPHAAEQGQSAVSAERPNSPAGESVQELLSLHSALPKALPGTGQL